MPCALLSLLLLFAAPEADELTEVEKLKKRVTDLESEVKSLRDELLKLRSELRALTPPKSDKPQSLQISIIPGGWGDGPPENILAVCRSAANELWQHFPGRTIEPITIRQDSKQGPMVIFGTGKDGERRVLLNTKDTFWSQYAFQFGHEFCHILCNYREADTANLWFEETLCETASLFVLRRMAETWKTRPPYSNWKDYSTSLSKYAEDRLKNTASLEDMTLAKWFQKNEWSLRRSGVQREKNQVVAAALLPLFEKNPKHWQAVQYLNQWDKSKTLSFAEYLKDWHQRVPREHQPFVVEVGKLFDISVP